MATETAVFVGGTASGTASYLNPRMANRHGLISGATGTGKTVTLQRLTEQFARQGIPVFLADVKGDLSGLSQTGGGNPKIQDRINTLGLKEFQFRPYPAVFWDVYGKQGHPLRATVSDMGPLLLSRLLGLNETQEGLLHIAFSIADDQGLLLLDLKDLRSFLTWMGEHAAQLKAQYGNIPTISLGTIQRQLLVLAEANEEVFFGEPAVQLDHLMQRDFSGVGVVSILDSRQLMTDPRIYTSMMLWLLSELFEELPEVGDQDRPKLVFFFDEAHLLFKDAPKVLLEKIEQVVRLIRSKGVGIYFVTQNPLDVPETVLGQLGNRIQHALRAFTPQDQKAVKTAAQTFRANPGLDTEKAITELAVGEALVSVLDLEGRPTPVERILIAPPESKVGAISDEERAEKIRLSPLAGRYDQLLDRESAYEVLKQREVAIPTPPAPPAEAPQPAAPREPASRQARTSSRQTVAEAMIKSTVRSIGSQLGHQLVRGVLGSILGGSGRRVRF